MSRLGLVGLLALGAACAPTRLHIIPEGNSVQQVFVVVDQFNDLEGKFRSDQSPSTTLGNLAQNLADDASEGYASIVLKQAEEGETREWDVLEGPTGRYMKLKVIDAKVVVSLAKAAHKTYPTLAVGIISLAEGDGQEPTYSGLLLSPGDVKAGGFSSGPAYDIRLLDFKQPVKEIR